MSFFWFHDTTWGEHLVFQLLKLNCRIPQNSVQLHLPWEPTTFIFRGYSPYILGVQNLHVSWFWGLMVEDIVRFTVLTNASSKRHSHYHKILAQTTLDKEIVVRNDLSIISTCSPARLIMVSIILYISNILKIRWWNMAALITNSITSTYLFNHPKFRPEQTILPR